MKKKIKKKIKLEQDSTFYKLFNSNVITKFFAAIFTCL